MDGSALSLCPKVSAGYQKGYTFSINTKNDRIMNEEIFSSIVEDMNNEFDSHDFIKEFIWRHPAIYGQLLVKYDNVRIAHNQIGKFLLNHADVLEIEKVGDSGTDDIFGHVNSCAKWKKK